jgi:hypothetical protein
MNGPLLDAYAIQTRMIVEACQRLAALAPLETHRYVESGGMDFGRTTQMHNGLGVQRMYSIQTGDEDADRVKFNRPYETLELIFEIPANGLPQALQEDHVPSIVWLDYPAPLSPDMIQDVGFAIRKAGPGSVVIATVESDFDAPPGERLSIMRDLLPGQLDDDLKSSSMFGWGVADSQRSVLQTNANGGARQDHGGSFQQLFNFQFRRGEKRSLTWGGIVASSHARELDNCRFDDLPYVRKKAKSLRIDVPHMTLREYEHLVHRLGGPPGVLPVLKGIPEEHVKSLAEVYRWQGS